MTKAMEALYETILERRRAPQEGSYTCYLFAQGRDKILKKLGEECAETIIAAKNADAAEVTTEACDLIYHLLVLLAEQGVPLSRVEEELSRRARKIGNLKAGKQTDRET